MRIFLLWFLNALALIAVGYFIPGVRIDGLSGALVAALFLGLVNTLIRPLLIVLTLPVSVLTLGLFIFVLNGLLFWFVGTQLTSFKVAGFWPAFFGAILYSIFSWAMSFLLRRR